MTEEKRIVRFPPSSEDEQIQRRIREVQRLAGLAPGEYLLWLPKSAERLGMSTADFEDSGRDQAQGAKANPG
jgi:hypothetical protein